MGRKITQDIFEKEMKEKHPNLTPLAKYNGSKGEIVVRCNIHNYEFKTTPNRLQQGQGCKYCSLESRSAKMRKGINKVESDFRQVHGEKYYYPHLESEYKSNKSNITYICPIHGEQHIQALKHLQGEGCKYCSHQSYPHTYETFCTLADIVHNRKYKYIKETFIDTETPMSMICPIHGKFEQTPKYHLQGCGCQKCKESTLEREIRNMLVSNHIKYIYEYKEHTTNNKSVDFYLLEYKTAIECQGIQHFKPISFFGGEDNFNRTVKRDIEKFNELIGNGDNVLYITNKRYKDYISNTIYNGRIYFIEDIKQNKETFNEQLKR